MSDQNIQQFEILALSGTSYETGQYVQQIEVLALVSTEDNPVTTGTRRLKQETLIY